VVTGVVAIAVLTLLFVAALNFVLDEYAKGAIHTAVDDAAQAGATAGGSLLACQEEAARVRDNLLPGAFGSGVSITCSLQGEYVVAVASGALTSLLPTVPDAHITVLGLSVVERAPGQ
jgi:hypothetical protein